MNELTSSPLFGIVLCIFTFELGIYINKKVKTPIANPLLIAIAFVIVILKAFHIPLDKFNVGGDIIAMFLGPATAVLALSIYNQIDILKKNFIPIFIGCLVGAITSMTSSYLLSKAFRLDEVIARSMIPKSVTTPIAMEVSKSLSGIVPVTVAVVIVTGIIGCVFSPLLIKLFRIKDPVAKGVAIGASSHALGTSKAIELGEIEGAMSGIAIGISGLITVFLSMLI
ncbi:LrgB family protein [Anaeromicropila herbilytica]|uniref:Membrane protein n=1 Tax=Anaeromicropila herbilytica TaxID=2785025 RepID=A0A7R7EJH2_9FIRM|nr:LrgB family protein [Anaeromicropila herbilytica]BCN29821.1 membrane protein [Anaeromicropila herbilytica]